LDINPVILVSSASDYGLFNLWSLTKGRRTHFSGKGICRALCCTQWQGHHEYVGW